MRKFLGGMVLAVAASGCAFPIRTPVAGYLYTGTQASEGVANGAVQGKVGEACAISVLGLIAVGDASVAAAAAEGGITNVTTVDGAYTGILGVYASHCTVVTGN